jgi:hypothetical protein
METSENVQPNWSVIYAYLANLIAPHLSVPSSTTDSPSLESSLRHSKQSSLREIRFEEMSPLDQLTVRLLMDNLAKSVSLKEWQQHHTDFLSHCQSLLTQIQQSHISTSSSTSKTNNTNANPNTESNTESNTTTTNTDPNSPSAMNASTFPTN